MRGRIFVITLSALVVFSLGCARAPKAEPQAAPERARGEKSQTWSADYASKIDQFFKADFNQAAPAEDLARLDQDTRLRACALYRNDPPSRVALKLEQIESEREIVYPKSGELLGDWKNGMDLASKGKGGMIGFIQPDKPGQKKYGNCYACHQLDAAEISYGTIGPSLLHYGKNRDYSDDGVRYVYGKIYNSATDSACSLMPRYGHHGWLTPEEIADLTALLMSPDSPVNK